MYMGKIMLTSWGPVIYSRHTPYRGRCHKGEYPMRISTLFLASLMMLGWSAFAPPASGQEVRVSASTQPFDGRLVEDAHHGIIALRGDGEPSLSNDLLSVQALCFGGPAHYAGVYPGTGQLLYACAPSAAHLVSDPINRGSALEAMLDLRPGLYAGWKGGQPVLVILNGHAYLTCHQAGQPLTPGLQSADGYFYHSCATS